MKIVQEYTKDLHEKWIFVKILPQMGKKKNWSNSGRHPHLRPDLKMLKDFST